MDLRTRFGTEPEMEVDGVDVHLGDDAYITIARAGGANVAYQREMTRAFRSHKHALKADTITTEEADVLMHGVLARTVVLGWRGVELPPADNPKAPAVPLAFTQENIMRVFKEIPEVYRIVMEESGRLANFRTEEIRDRGNASAPI